MNDTSKRNEARRKPAVEFVFAIQFAGQEREVLLVKESGGDVICFPPYAKGRSPKDFGIDVHVSKHRSGERHLRWKLNRERIPTPETIVKLQPTSRFSGAELLIHMPLLKGQFPGLLPAGTNSGKLVLLDADSAGFSDDFLAVRAFLVEPGKQDEIKPPTCVGPCIRHIERSITPWIVVEVFQQVTDA